MKITEIRTRVVTIPLLTEFKTSLRCVREIENILVTITTDSEQSGFGGAAPTTVITGETVSSILGAITVIAAAITGMDIRNHEAALQRLNNCIVGNMSAKAAVDMAIYDLLAKSFQTPLYRLLGGLSKRIETDMTISLDSPENMVQESQQRVAEGFSILKIKVGSDPLLDIERLSAISKAVGSHIRIRVDANQAWTAKEVLLISAELSRRQLPVELIEQPVRAADIEGLKIVCAGSCFPVYADESVFSPADALHLIRDNGVDGINIKLMKCGGIYNGLKIAAIAESAGIPCMIGSMMESHVSVTAAAHLAAAKTVISGYDLDAPLFCSSNPAVGGIDYHDADVLLPDEPGLGIARLLD
ncbi:MAG: dipeptide epimerase [Desulfocapsaceae bacterium]|jgi:L-alanine-DL-glutamate epimerase-like enolase superfamily enzyme|nr:dipeptide epimerase [Desulfocapsaceae bacterium]